ncbi:unnamed protein product, partial [Effrenium voratum]
EFLRECFSASMGFCFVRMAELTARPYCSMMDTSIIVAFPLTWAAFIATALIFKFCDPGDEPDKGPVPEDVAHLLHSAANSCGIIVGLAWDKAFESLAINMTAGWNGHYVISKCVLATVVWASVVPTWLWYLVPQEKKLEAILLGAAEALLEEDFVVLPLPFLAPADRCDRASAAEALKSRGRWQPEFPEFENDTMGRSFPRNKVSWLDDSEENLEEICKELVELAEILTGITADLGFHGSGRTG